MEETGQDMPKQQLETDMPKQQSETIQPIKGSLPVIPIIAIIIILVLGIVGYSTFFSNPHTTQITNKTTQPSTQPTSTITLPNQGNTTSTQIYMSETQASSLIGNGGNYTASPLNQSSLSFFPSNLSITGGYSMQYINNSNPSQKSITEIVLLTQKQNMTYDSLLSEYSIQYFNKTFFENGANYGATIQIAFNATTNGMTYSWSSSHDNGSVTPYVIAIIGKKNNVVSFITIINNQSLPSPSLVASLMAENMP
ncbi:MAG: hypothetical protein KGH67_05675 [Candidatus Micrarchaeota archaeon]|nr:hypothetical protein [Candidatus Micrarchaeota archaeon]